MNDEKRFRLTPQLVLGLVLILLGLVFVLDNLGLIYRGDYLRYWPALVILFGLIKLAQSDGAAGRVGGVILIALGGLLLLRSLDLVYFNFWDFFWPVLFIAAGISMMMRAWTRYRRQDGNLDSDNYVHGLAIMGGFERTNNSQDFRGGELTAIMGGCKLDLRQAAMRGNEAVIDVLAWWGGIEIRVPETWSVTLKGLPIMGGFADSTLPPKSDTGKRLIIKGIAVMGGAEVKN
ncbi:MAG: cell wall-active antibiotics response protein [candidate division KSB1 bacterium]|nr:cell wall-active antibiotics response protein [candidate division KSB1 bacterium]MDZ7275008.1 cell wall-active antibiotics response protein [candidate division KSB1 bacterium]MDZ7286543.1 cell wall-active antibiotics response protein [candidate division KSB1 bacterium]MDZ7299293.1 cell wall-active antibiotics response protein [candidate division KSB1 bacterium]MDZ7307367.1 cell wall-active antibiotics response protein [candidate division KSB1 bacterium]